MTEGDDDAVGRRAFLRTAAGAAAAAGAAGTAAAQEGNNSSGGNESGGSGGGASTTVAVGPGGQLVFQPSEVQIQPGGTVKWIWESGGHNVVPESGGDWGHQPLENQGFTYSHTFESAGENPYVCEPHASAGMTGTVIVGSGGGGSSTVLPSSAKSLGVAAVAAMMSTLGLAYFFIRYGGDYEQPSE